MLPAWGIGVLVLTVVGAALAWAIVIRGYQSSSGQSRGDGTAASTDQYDVDLSGEWKHETAEAEAAHRRAQRREPPVEIGEHVSVPVREVDRAEEQARGQVEKFQVFVDDDVPETLSKGDVIRVQIMDWATNEAGLKVGAHARFVEYGR